MRYCRRMSRGRNVIIHPIWGIQFKIGFLIAEQSAGGCQSTTASNPRQRLMSTFNLTSRILGSIRSTGNRSTVVAGQPQDTWAHLRVGKHRRRRCPRQSRIRVLKRVSCVLSPSPVPRCLTQEFGTGRRSRPCDSGPYSCHRFLVTHSLLDSVRLELYIFCSSEAKLLKKRVREWNESCCTSEYRNVGNLRLKIGLVSWLFSARPSHSQNHTTPGVCT